MPFASALAGYVVAPTYPFPITYVPGGGIHPHLDVSDNELSLTFQALGALGALGALEARLVRATADARVRVRARVAVGG